MRASGADVAEVTDRRTAIDFAKILKELSDTHFPRAEKIILVQDNLNTHSPSSLYEAFAPAEARRLIERFEWHYTPKHGSWLNLAESELPCSHNAKADWRFTTADARIKLNSLYPVL